jgi:anti-sigma28 factor (negative regulator of flagellin synthesis)
MDMTRVIELNDRLEKGKLAIDSRSLADKMLNFDRDSSHATEHHELPSKD